MSSHWKVIFIALCVAWLVMSMDASAITNNPGSLLLFPYFDTTSQQSMTIFTVNNVSDQSVWIRLMWVASDDGIPRDLWFDLAGKDSFCFVDQAIFFGNTKGFIYVYVVDDEYSVGEIEANVLVGQEIIIGYAGHGMDSVCVNALAFTAFDLNPDGNLHLDGKEYELAPKSVHFPHFFGQSETIRSQVLFIGLTGGTYFSTWIEALVYNDQGSVFNSVVIVPTACTLVDLMDISPATSNDFLLGTSHDPDEPIGLSGVVEAGSLTFTGLEARGHFIPYVIEHPSIVAFLFESIGPLGYTVTLPFQTEDPAVYNNGMLWSTKINGGGN